MNTQFDTLRTYLKSAKNIICYMAHKHKSSVIRHLLKDEDAISDIATALMMADWTYDKNKIGLSGKPASKQTHRYNTAKWAIKKYLTKAYKKKTININTYSIVDGYSFEKDIIFNDSMNNIYNIINKILSNNGKQIITYYIQGLTLREIGKLYNISRQAVHQNIRRSIRKLKIYIKENNVN